MEKVSQENCTCSCRKWVIPTITVATILFVFIFSRLVLYWFDAASPWASYVYQYGFGIVTFLIGLLVVIKNKALVPGRGRDSYWLKWLIAGLVIYIVFNFVWILMALYIPFKG